MNTPVSFELAKLLKEKGFDIPVGSYYSGDKFCLNYSIINQYPHEYVEDRGECLIIPYTSGEGSLYLETINFNGWGVNDYSAPTIADVVMWLYEKHGIWINLSHLPFNQKFGLKITGKFQDGNNDILYSYYFKHYDLPTEAYLTAIEYCLTKLI